MLLYMRLTSIQRYKRCTLRLLSTAADVLHRVRLRDKSPVCICRKSAEAVELGPQFAISLDGALLESPLGNLMTTRSRIVAELVVDEWRSHIGQLTRFGTIPTTMLLSEMIDLCHSKRDAVMKGIMLALNFDTALRFDRRDVVELPPLDSLSTLDTRRIDALAKLDLDVLQSSYLVPILEKFAKRRGTSPLAHSASLTTELQQPPDVLKNIEHMLHSMPLHELVTMNNLHKRLKSVILPMELLDGAIGATQALRASRLEETLQAASWGLDEEFLNHEETMLKELNAALRFREAHIHSGT